MSDPKLNLPNNAVSNAADIILDALPDEVRIPIAFTGIYAINPEWTQPLATHLQHVIAYVIAGILNAGSERDAVMENVNLAAEIAAEIEGWGPAREDEET